MGPHGREWCSRIACALLLAMASSLFPLVAAADAPQPAAGSDAALAINTLIVRREPMLDVADAGEWLVVLGPDSVAVYRRDDAIRRGAPVATVPVVHTRPWPRDLRGTLTVDGMRFQVFLPGVVCRGVIQPLAASCVDENTAWPLALDNGGVMPSRNNFITPEGLPFYSAASLTPLQSPRWIVADTAGSLAFLDATRRMVGRGEAVDDVARLESDCGAGPLIVTVVQTAVPERDEIRLQSVGPDVTLVEHDRLTLSGVVTALWAKPGSATAIVVVRAAGGQRHEAHQVSVACAR